MHLTARLANVNDFDTMARLCLNTGESMAQRRACWEILWTHGSTFGVVATDLANRTGKRDLAVMVGTYIQDFAVEKLKKAKTPLAIHRLCKLHEEGERPFVTPKEQGEQNAGSGMNLKIAYLGWVGAEYDAEPAPNLRAFVSNAFIDRHGGNRLQMVLGEVCGPAFAELADRAGFEVLNSYGSWAQRAATDENRPYLVGIHRDRALLRENHWLGKLFTYFPPRFFFTQPQRQILLLAREGYTDTEIAQILDAKADAIKKRWGSIYERVNEVFPSLLPSSNSSGRGSEKRRALLAHLRDRPEELRPYVRGPVELARVSSVR
jgi:hypothetical protein